MTPFSETLLMAAANLPIAAAALLIDRLLGYPNGLQDWIGHPVDWMGRAIAWLERRINLGASRTAKGIFAVLALLVLVAAVCLPLALWLRGVESGWIAEALLASALLSQQSLEDHVRAVEAALRSSLAEGRKAVGLIVGRDTRSLDRSGVVRGAIESLAENMSDGVVAPLFWLLLFGLPGIVLYKAVNTADSVVGHRSERFHAFGWAAARLDDVLNLVPARATGWLIALAAALVPGMSGRRAIGAMVRDAKSHESPNAGWPEAAMAGALNIRLGGPRKYEGRRVELAWMGSGRNSLKREDIGNGLRVYNVALNLLTAAVLAACIMSWVA